MLPLHGEIDRRVEHRKLVAQIRGIEPVPQGSLAKVIGCEGTKAVGVQRVGGSAERGQGAATPPLQLPGQFQIRIGAEITYAVVETLQRAAGAIAGEQNVRMQKPQRRAARTEQRPFEVRLDLGQQRLRVVQLAAGAGDRGEMKSSSASSGCRS